MKFIPALRSIHLFGLICAVLLLLGEFPLEGVYFGMGVKAALANPGKAASDNQMIIKAIPTTRLVTVTPQANGCTVHVVGSGQTLWSIALAYGVKVDEIRALNGIASDSTTIYIGQKLFVLCVTATPNSQLSETVASPTETPSPTKAAVTATLSPLPARVSAIPITSNQESSAIQGPPRALIAGVLILAGGTLVVLLAFALIKRQG